MSGNLKPFVLQSSTAVAFTLEVGGSQVLNETYYPGNGNLIEIDLREVVESYLSFTFPSSDVFNQTLLVRSFTAKFDGQTVSFNAIRAGKARLNQSASEFLKENFLTWQPQVKPVTYYSPEWLTYYAVESCRIKLKAYFEGGTSSETTLVSPSAGTCYTLNLQYGVVSGKFSGKRPTYYDVWVESTGGQRLTYVQRYIGSQRRSEDENWYLFENSLGGLDSLRAYGALEDAPEYEHNIAQLDGVLTEYRVDTNRKYTRNTGYLTPKEAEWLQDMFSCRQKYAYTLSGYYKIVFTASDGGRSSTDLPSSYSFTYQFAEDLPFLDIQRREDLPDNLELKTPEGETFFLPPRLAEFPKLSLSPDLLLPAQEPHTEKWGAITAGTLKDTVLNELIEQLQGLDMDPEPAGGLDAYLIKVGDLTVPTDDNIFSAARTLQEIQKNSLWELVTKALDGSDLPEEQQYLTPLFGRNIVVTGDVIAFADGGEYASGLPVADFDTFGLFKAKRDGGLLFDEIEGWYVDPQYAGGGGIDIDQLQKYLNDNGYLKLSSPLTGYAIPEAYSPIAATDTILSAIGKLERNFDNYVDLTTNQTIGGVKTFNETLLSKKDVIAYADGGEYASGLPVADTVTYGLVKVDGTTVRINASGQLEADAGGGIDFEVGTGLQMSVSSVLSVKYGTTAGTVCQGNDSRLSDARRNPYALSWSGYSTGSYDGSQSKSISIPNSTSQLTNDAGFLKDANRNFTSLSGSGNSYQYLSGNGVFKTISYNDISGLSDNFVKKSGDTMTGMLTLQYGNESTVKVIMGSNANKWASFSTVSNAGYSGAIKSSDAFFVIAGNVYNNRVEFNGGTITATGDIVAFADGGAYASGLPVADQYTYGLTKYDGTTIGKNSSGQLYVINAGSGGSGSVTWNDVTGKPSWIGASKPTYAWSEITSKPTWIGSSKPSYSWSEITSKPTWIGSSKPSYSWSEITSKPSWIGSSKPTYTASEVGAISSIGHTSTGSGNVVTSVTASGRTITVKYGSLSGSWNGGTITNAITKSGTSQAFYLSSVSGGWAIGCSSSEAWLQAYGSAATAIYCSGYRQVWINTGSHTRSAWVVDSDMRIKTKLSDFIGVLDKINRIDVFRYKRNDDNRGTVFIGVSAQQLLPVFPEFVSHDESTDLYGVMYDQLGAAIAIQGIKELYTRFLPVENKVKILESRVQNLQLRLDNAYREIFELKRQMGGAA